MFYIKQRLPFPIIDIYLFKWNNFKSTGIHNHAKNGCYIFLIKGKLKEDIYNNKLTKINTNLHSSPSISYMSDKIGYHDITPLKKSISVHFYYPKNHKTKFLKY